MKINLRFASPLLKTDDVHFSRIVRAVAEVAILANRRFLLEYPETPRLYASRVRYENEPIGSIDEIVDIPTVIARRKGDCFHLAAWRVAELRNSGEEKASIALKSSRPEKNFRLFHVCVRRADGEFEDPSRMLGM